jgi:hypothetical protein
MNVRVDTDPKTRAAVCELLCEHLEKGLSITRACDIVGVSYSMYDGWRDAARRGDDEAILLLRGMRRARAIGLDKHIGVIRAAAENDDWRASAWLIERQYGDLRAGAPIEEIEVPDPQEQRVDQFGNKVDLSGYSSEKRRTMLDQITAEITGTSKQPLQQQATLTADQKRAHRRELIRVSLFTALNGHQDGRDREDAIEIVKASTGCDAIEVKQAATYLGVEDVQQSRWPNVRVVWKLPDKRHPDRTRLHSNEADAVDSGRSASEPEIAGVPNESQAARQAPFFGGVGSGDASRRRRGR